LRIGAIVSYAPIRKQKKMSASGQLQKTKKKG